MEDKQQNIDIDAQAGAEDKQQGEEKPAEKKFTQAELDDIISKRLAKERAKFEEQLKNKVSEAERLAKLSEDERQKEEIRIAQEEIVKGYLLVWLIK